MSCRLGLKDGVPFWVVFPLERKSLELSSRFRLAGSCGERLSLAGSGGRFSKPLLESIATSMGSRSWSTRCFASGARYVERVGGF